MQNLRQHYGIEFLYLNDFDCKVKRLYVVSNIILTYFTSCLIWKMKSGYSKIECCIPYNINRVMDKTQLSMAHTNKEQTP